MPIEPGQQLLHYRLIEKIGEGGMGVVWKAVDTTLDREVAIKVLPDAFADDADRLARFEREAKLLASLNHANIATVHSVHLADGTRFLAMELVHGEDLAQRLTRGAIPIDEALTIAVQIAEALEAAHDAGVIHRDLKPANIKLTPDDKIKVLDFGLAKAFDTVASSSDASMSPTVTSAGTMVGTIIGTAAYMSPEQAHGRAVDRRADIWAFGCVLYEILTGTTAFRGESISDTLASVLKFEPDYDRLPSDLPHAVRRLLRRCAEKKPKQRLQAIGEARITLEETIAGADEVDPPPSTQGASRPRGVRAWMLVAVALIGLVVGGVASWNMKPGASRLITRFPLDLADEMDVFDSPALSPDGRTLVYASNGRLYKHGMDQALPTVIPGTERATHAFFAPDGRSVGYFTPTQLRKVDLDGTPPIALAEVDQGIGGEWDRNGNIFFGQSGPFGLFRVAATGGTPVPFAEQGNYRDLDYPDVLPGGEWVVFTALHMGGRWDDAQILAKSIKSGEQKALIEAGHYARYVPTGHLIFGRKGTLFAVEFDVDRIETVGVPVPVLENVFLNGTIGGNGQFAVADNGTLVFASGAHKERVLALADRRGAVERLDVPPQPYTHARVSPDGTRIVAQTVDSGGKSQMWLYDLSGDTALRPLLQRNDARSPVWTADSRQLVFAATIDGTRGIWVQPVDGGAGPELWTAIESAVEYLTMQFSISPDGSSLIFVRADPGSIWSVSEPGAPPEPLVPRDTGLLGGPVFSPDGNWVAYWGTKGNAARTAAIHATPFPWTGDVYSTLEEDRFYPVWSPDGKELFYTTIAGDLFSRSVSTSGTFTFGPERPLPIESHFSGETRSFDVMPDGQRLLVIVPSEVAPPRINVVLNWFDELEQRMAAP